MILFITFLAAWHAQVNTKLLTKHANLFPSQGKHMMEIEDAFSPPPRGMSGRTYSAWITDNFFPAVFYIMIGHTFTQPIISNENTEKILPSVQQIF